MVLGPTIVREVAPYYKWFEAYMDYKPIKYIGKMYYILQHEYVVGRSGWVDARLTMREVIEP